MSRSLSADRVSAIAAEALSLLGTGRQVAPFTARYPDLDLGQAYEVAARLRDLRASRDERAVGRKIGFTNRAVWASRGIAAPMWGYMFDTTVHDLSATGGTFALGALPEPRIEPEIVVHLAAAPTPGMSEAELLECIDWVAHGFEIVFSIFPGWRFEAADATVAYGVHGALLLGERRAVRDDRADWGRRLSDFDIELARGDGATWHGQARNVLGGPLTALRFLVEEIARHPASEPLGAGEIVTTGTLTEAPAAVPGERWSTRLGGGIGLNGLELAFA
ncbi:MAG: hydratase [Pseudomonadota bacterium]